MKSSRVIFVIPLAFTLSFGLSGCSNDEIDVAKEDNTKKTQPPSTQKVMLQVSSFGKGKVKVNTGTDQLSCGGSEGVCKFQLNKGEDVTLTPVTTDPNYAFQAWTCAVRLAPSPKSRPARSHSAGTGWLRRRLSCKSRSGRVKRLTRFQSVKFSASSTTPLIQTTLHSRRTRI